MKTDKWNAFATISLMAALLLSLAAFLLAIVKEQFWIALLLGFIIGIEFRLAIAFYRMIESILLDIARWLAGQEKAQPLESQQSNDQQTRQSKATQPEANQGAPWERIPDHNWDRQALKMWWEGYTAPEIAKAVHVDPQRVRNRLSELRRQHGTEVVPYDKERNTL